MLDGAILEDWKNSPGRKQWLEEGAYDQFLDIEAKLPPGRRARDRIGALLIQPMQGLDGLHCWMSPVEGYPKLLGPKSFVEIFSPEGQSLYSGDWQGVSRDLLEPERFFIWLEGRPEASPPPKDFLTRLIGAWRWIKYRVGGKRK